MSIVTGALAALGVLLLVVVGGLVIYFRVARWWGRYVG